MLKDDIAPTNYGVDLQSVLSFMAKKYTVCCFVEFHDARVSN